MKHLRCFAGPSAAALLVILAGLWHFFDTAAGASGSGDLWLTGAYWLLFAAAAAALFLAGFLLFKKDIRWEWRYLAAVVSFGLLYLFVLPPLSAPDEISHFVSAYELSSRLLGTEAADENGYVLIRQADDFLQNIYGAEGDEERISLGRELDEETYRILREKNDGLFVSREEQALTPSVYRSVKTTPLSYLPQALGIAAARVFRLNGVWLSYLGRVFNLLFFAAMGTAAIRLLPFGKPVFLGVSLLPMALHLAASYSYDAFVMGLCFFYGAYCLNLAFVKPEVKRRDVAVLAAVMAAVGPCKMIYAVVMGFALLIPVKKFGSVKNWAVSAAAVFLVFAAAMALVNGGTIAGYAAGSDTYVSWAAEEGYSIPYILHNPADFLAILYRTAAVQAEEWYVTMIGGKLGNLDPVLSVPFYIVAGMTACLFGLSVRKAGEALYLRTAQKVWILFLAAACLLGLMAAMLVGWTPLSSQVIAGVQGRYLLPFLPFVLMTVKSERLVRTAGSDETLLFYICAMDAYALLRLFSIVSMRL